MGSGNHQVCSPPVSLLQDQKIRALEELVETLQEHQGKRPSVGWSAPLCIPPGPATSGYQGFESIKLSPVVESGQWSPERSSDTQGSALLCGTESPERSPSPALSTGPASQSLEERQPRQEPCSVGWWPPESQGLPSQGQGERPRGASPGIPRVLVEQLLQMTLRPKLLS